MNRRTFSLSLAFTALLPGSIARAVEGAPVTVYRDPSCGCCEAWVEHMRKAGFAVEVVDESDLAGRHASLSIPAELAGCHVAVIGDFAFSGHVPAGDISAFISYPPAGAFGLAVPGMPTGSPGMGETGEPYEVMLLARNGPPSVYARH
ncbi:MAG: DUF411 domain-containing protein [Methylococcaceae bacterium]|nr:DUF411 domain-containing protein [Methylococcaceae bacterium]